MNELIKRAKAALEACTDKAEAFELQRDYIKLLEAELFESNERERRANIREDERGYGRYDGLS